MNRRSLDLQALGLIAGLAFGGCNGDAAENTGAAGSGSHTGAAGGGAGVAGAGSAGGAGAIGGGTAGSASAAGGGSSHTETGGEGGVGGGAALSCVPERYYPCAAPAGLCIDDGPGVQRCAESGQAGSCVCAPSCGGQTIDTNFSADACRVAFTGDPEALGSGWADALSVSIFDDLNAEQQIQRVEDENQCDGRPGWYQLGVRAIGLCPVSCAAVVAGSQYSAVIGCPTIWRAD